MIAPDCPSELISLQFGVKSTRKSAAEPNRTLDQKTSGIQLLSIQKKKALLTRLGWTDPWQVDIVGSFPSASPVEVRAEDERTGRVRPLITVQSGNSMIGLQKKQKKPHFLIVNLDSQ